MSDLLVTTDNERNGILIEQIARNVGLFDMIRKKGGYRAHTGGKKIQVDMSYKENAGFQFQTQEQKMSTIHTQPLTFAEYDVKIATVPVTLFDLEDKLNKGPQAHHNIEAARLKNAETTMINQIGAGALYGTGTGFGGKAIAGLQLYISPTPAVGTVGGINRATAPHWRNQVISALTDLGAAKAVTNFRRGLGKLHRSATIKGMGPNCYIADNEDFELFESALQAIERVSSAEEADSDYDMLRYKGKPFIFDGGLDGGCPPNTTYALRLEDFDFVYVEGRNMQMIPERVPTDQLAKIFYKVFYGNLIMKRARHSGIFTA